MQRTFVTALAVALLAGCSPSRSSGIHRSRGALVSQGLTLDPAGYAGPVCIGSFGCTGGSRLTYHLPAGRHVIQAWGSVGPDGSAALGTIEVDGAGNATLAAPAFDTPDDRTLLLRTTQVKIAFGGYPGTLWIEQVGAGSGPEWNVTLIRGRRYRMVDYYSSGAGEGEGAAFSAAAELGTSEDGVPEVGAELGRSFETDAAARTVRARIERVTLSFAGYPGSVWVEGVTAGAGPTWEMPLIRGRLYRLIDYYSRGAGPEGHAGFSDGRDVGVDHDGQLVVGPGARRHLEPTGARDLRLRLEPVTLELADYPGPIWIEGVTAGSGPRWEMPMLRGRLYRLVDYYSQGAAPGGHAGFSDTREVGTDDDGNLVLGEQSRRHFDPVAARTIRARLLPVTLDFAGYPGPIWVEGVTPGGGPRWDMPLFRGRLYRLIDYYSQGASGGHAGFSDTREVGTDHDGNLVLGEQSRRHFDPVAARTIRARLLPVTLDFAGYPGPIWVEGVTPGAGPRWEMPLMRGRLYRLVDYYSQGASAGGHAGLSDTREVGTDHDGNLVLGEQSRRHLEGDAASRTVRARTEAVTVDFGGYLTPLWVEGVATLAGPTGTAWLMRERLYRIVDYYSGDPDGAGAALSPARDVGLDTNGLLTVGPGAARYFQVFPEQRRMRALTTDVTLTSNGYAGSFCLGNIACASGAGSALTATTLVNRRYRVDPGAQTVVVGPGGTCPDLALTAPGGALLTTCTPVPAPPPLPPLPPPPAPVACQGGAGAMCEDGNACTTGDSCNATGQCVAGGPTACLDDGRPCTVSRCVPPNGCVTELVPGCDNSGTCSTVNGELRCEPFFSISVDATEIEPGTFTVTSAGGVFHTELATTAVQRLQLRVGVDYVFRALGGSMTALFRLTAAGIITMTDSDFVHGNGTTTLLALSPAKPQARLEWQMAERMVRDGKLSFLPVKTDARPDLVKVEVEPASWTVHLDGCQSLGGDSPLVRWRWELSPVTVGRPPEDQLGGTVDLPLPRVEEFETCRGTVQFDELGRYTARLTVTAADGQTATTTGELALKDYLVVGLGDSYGSGEGNPTDNLEDLYAGGIYPITYLNFWDEPGKHLSRWAAQVQAALMLELSDPHSSVTFVSFARSGSTIGELIHDPQLPFPLDSKYYHCGTPGLFCYPPQIQEAKQFLCGEDGDCTGARTIDYLLLSVGGNDVHFSGIIEECASPIGIAGLDVEKNCAATPVEDSPGGVFRIPYRATGWAGNDFTRGVGDDIERVLPAHYAELNTALRSELPLRRGSQVLITTYPNPLVANPESSEPGRFCSELVFKNAVCSAIPGQLFDGDPRSNDWCPNGIVDQNESWWANDHVIGPINQAARNTAAFTDSQAGITWLPVDGIAEQFGGHAYCSDANFLVTYEESFRTQDERSGSMHPNRAGQAVIAGALAEKMGVTARAFTAPLAVGCFRRPEPGSVDDDAVVGAGCRGDYCGQVDPVCRPVPPGVTLGTDYPARAISEEDNGTFTSCHHRGVDHCIEQTGTSCGEGVVRTISCTGDHCDGVTLSCRALTSGHLANCQWTEGVSDESRWNIFMPGKYANGVQCDGYFCDRMRYYVCDLVP